MVQLLVGWRKVTNLVWVETAHELEVEGLTHHIVLSSQELESLLSVRKWLRNVWPKLDLLTWLDGLAILLRWWNTPIRLTLYPVTVLQKNLNEHLQAFNFYLIWILIEVWLHIINLILHLTDFVLELVKYVRTYGLRWLASLTPSIFSALALTPAVVTCPLSVIRRPPPNAKEIRVDLAFNKLLLVGLCHLTDKPVEIALIQHLIVLNDRQILQVFLDEKEL